MLQKNIAEVRAFNRFYTRVTGLLDKYILHSNYTLPEARILYEIYHNENIQAGDIIASTGIDKGYLSRILKIFVAKKLVAKKRSVQDGRSVHLSLTTQGKREFEALNAVQDEEIKKLLEMMPVDEREKLVYHMAEINKILSNTIS